MTPWHRITRAGRKLLGRDKAEPETADAAAPGDATELGAQDPGLPENDGPDDDAPPPAEPELSQTATSRGLSSWLEVRAERVVGRIYEARAQDLEERAQRIVQSAYQRSADDLEERAVRAMRRAIESEAERLKQAIEHAIAVKKREVRLSLLVLVASSLVYLALYWFTRSFEGP